MGIGNALRIEEAGANMSDSLVWSALAAGAIRKLGDVDLVIFGKESVDVGTDQHTYPTGAALGAGQCSAMCRPSLRRITARARSKSRRCWNRASRSFPPNCPAVISVMKGINEPRYPNFLGIRKAAKAEIPVWSAADLNVEMPSAGTKVLHYMNPPARDVSTEIIGGDSVADKTQVLVERLFEEKVL